MEEICPKTPKCPLFNDGLLKRQESAENYKSLYCRSESKYRECKRFIVSEQVGKCADFVMPNSFLSVDEIIVKMKGAGLIQ